MSVIQQIICCCALVLMLLSILPISSDGFNCLGIAGRDEGNEYSVQIDVRRAFSTGINALLVDVKAHLMLDEENVI